MMKSFEDKIGSIIGKKYINTYQKVIEEMWIAQVNELNTSLMDVCCGNGFFGLYYSKLHPHINVKSVDIRRTNQYEKISELFNQANHEFIELDITKNSLPIKKGTIISAIHACGELTDKIIEEAVKNRAPVAVVPCCYTKRIRFPTDNKLYESIQDATTAARFNYLRNNGYYARIRKMDIDSPMNIIIVGVPDIPSNHITIN